MGPPHAPLLTSAPGEVMAVRTIRGAFGPAGPKPLGNDVRRFFLVSSSGSPIRHSYEELEHLMA